MKGALQIAVMMVSALRIQKWLLCLGALLMITGYSIPVSDLRAVVVLGFVIALVPSLFMSGVQLRYFAAPQSMRLVPRGREQLLGGVALVVLTVSVASAVVTWSLGAPPKAVPVIGLWVAATTSIVVLSQFVLLSSPRGVMTWILLITLLASLPNSGTARQLLRSIGQNPEWLSALVVVLWAGFAIWFLRVHSFRTPSAVAQPGKGVLNMSVTQENALRAFLFGTPSLRQQLTGSGMVLLLVSVIWGLVFAVMEAKASLADSLIKTIGVALGIGAYAGIGGWVAARRSKSLWLHGGVDRMGLFRLCEAQAWKFFRITAIPALALLAIAWVVRPSVGISYTVQAAFYFCGGACLLYFGLMHVRGWRALDVACAILLGAAWMVMFATSQIAQGRHWLVPALMAVTLGAAFALRLVAMRRWRHIDWLVCKMPQYPARAGVSLVPQ
jgi:hypothetical protein